jgi:hypothetical protein
VGSKKAKVKVLLGELIYMFYVTVTEIIPMFQNVEMLDDDAFSLDQDDFSFAKKGLGDKMLREIDSAKAKQLAKEEVGTGDTIARQHRIEVNAELAKYFIGDVNIPIELLKPPEKQNAYRDYDKTHAAFCAKEMETAGKNYPHKPAAVCGFEV